MNVKETLKCSLLTYPVLYKNKLDVYNHLFLCIGTSYEWIDGELVDIKSITDKVSTTEDAIKLLFHAEEYDDDSDAIFDILCTGDKLDADNIPYLKAIYKRQMNQLLKHVLRVLPENVEKALSDMSVRYAKDDDPLDRTRLYPLCQYSNILNIPDNIKEDWKEAIRELYMFLIESDEPLVVKYRNDNKEWIEKIDVSKFK